MDNSNPVRDETDDRQIVGNEEIGQILFCLQLIHQVQDLCADRDIQSGDRLVRNDELRLHDHGAGDTDTLALSTGELMRVAGLVLRQKTDILKSLVYFGDTVIFILVQMEIQKAFRYTVLDRRSLIQRRRGILENHLDAADHISVLFFGNLTGNSLSFKCNFAGAAGVDAHNSAAQSGLAGSGLAHERKCLAFIDVEVRIADGFKFLLSSGIERYVHMLDGHNYFSVISIIRHGTLLPYLSFS